MNVLDQYAAQLQSAAADFVAMETAAREVGAEVFMDEIIFTSQEQKDAFDQAYERLKARPA